MDDRRRRNGEHLTELEAQVTLEVGFRGQVMTWFSLVLSLGLFLVLTFVLSGTLPLPLAAFATLAPAARYLLGGLLVLVAGGAVPVALRMYRERVVPGASLMVLYRASILLYTLDLVPTICGVLLYLMFGHWIWSLAGVAISAALLIMHRPRRGVWETTAAANTEGEAADETEEAADLPRA